MNRALTYFSHPLVGILGSIASILGFGCAFYFYYAAQAERLLTCQVDTGTTQLVKAGQSSDLTVSFHGQPITTDVTAAQILLWNAGKLSIKRSDVLAPITLVTRGNVPILAATVRATSRDLIGATLDTTAIAAGRLGISWAILEHNDGVRLQIIFAGGLDTKLDFEGALEGQGSVSLQEAENLNWKYVTGLVLLSLVGFAYFHLILNWSERPSFQRVINFPSWIAVAIIFSIIGSGGAIIGLGVHVLRIATRPSSPPQHLVSPSVVSVTPPPKSTP